MNKRRAGIIAASMIVTFIVVRSMLHLSPDSDFNVGGYNVHHLFTGLVLVTVSSIPLALFPGNSLLLDVMSAMLGAGLSLALDEWVYLIATDGSNASYLLPVSLKGGILMVGLAVAYLAILYILSKDKQPPSNSLK
jgi:hypothetical protein